MSIDKEILIKKYYQERESLRKIAKDFMICHITVINVMKKYGLKRRNHSESQIGRICSKKTKLKMRKAKLGKTLSEEHKKKVKASLKSFYDNHPRFAKIRNKSGKFHPMYKDGRTLKDYFCIDCGKEVTWQTGFKSTCRCQSCSRKEAFKNPENHPNWKGGVSKLPYPFEFNDRLKRKNP